MVLPVLGLYKFWCYNGWFSLYNILLRLFHQVMNWDITMFSLFLKYLFSVLNVEDIIFIKIEKYSLFFSAVGKLWRCHCVFDWMFGRVCLESRIWREWILWSFISFVCLLVGFKQIQVIFIKAIWYFRDFLLLLVWYVMFFRIYLSHLNFLNLLAHVVRMSNGKILNMWSVIIFLLFLHWFFVPSLIFFISLNKVYQSF